MSAIPRDQVGAVPTAHFLDRWECDEALVCVLRVGCHARGRRRPHAGDLRDAALTDRQHVSDDTSDIRLRAGLVATQILGLALCRYVLNFPLVAAMSRHSHNMVTGTRAMAAPG